MILQDDEVIKRGLKMYYEVSGISCFAVDSLGETVYYEGRRQEYCRRFKELTGDRCPCSSSHHYAGKQSEKIGEPYVYFCPGGLVHWTAPIIAKGLYRGAIEAGPAQMSLPDSYVVDEIIKANNFDIVNRGVLEAYLKVVPVIDPGKVRYLSEMLYLTAKDIMAEEARVLTERRSFYKDQAAINESIQNVKDQNHISKYYPFEMENELISMVRRGDKKGAKTILNEMLGHVLFSSGVNMEVTKARVLELMIVLSRAAVEGGGNLGMIFGLKFKYLNEVYHLNTVEELCEWIVKVLERFTDCIVQVSSNSSSCSIKKAIPYINEEYMNDISLESTAEYVYLSTSYFSRLFKKEMGMNFIDYLNKVRVEESKKYLADLKLSLSDIAHIVGFTDQSYYSKVFKKVQGTSPGQYRKM